MAARWKLRIVEVNKIGFYFVSHYSKVTGLNTQKVTVIFNFLKVGGM